MIALQRMTTFREELERWLDEHDETPFSFGKKLGHSSNSTVRKVLVGDIPVPLGDLDNWLAKMRVDDRERERLYRLALTDYAPPWVVQLLGRCDQLESQVDRVHAALSRHGLTLEQLERLAPQALAERENRPARKQDPA